MYWHVHNGFDCSVESEKAGKEASNLVSDNVEVEYGEVYLQRTQFILAE